MIRVEELELNRFRGIREGKITGFSDVNILIGRNNCGKSTVCEAISWAAGLLPATDPLGRNPADVWNQARKGAMGTELWYRQDQSHSMSVALKLNGTNVVRGFKADKSSLDNFDPELKRNSGHPVSLFLRNLAIFHPADGQNQQVERHLWPKLLANRADKALTQMLNDIFALDSEGCQLLPDQRLLVMFPEYSVPVDVQGDGTRATLRCLMVLAALNKTLFMIEEPESHQHPGSLERFALAICRQAQRQEVQLVLSTHSVECVKSFLRAAKEMGLETSLFHLNRENGDLDAKRLDAETVQTLQETGVDVRFLDLYAC